MAGEEKESIKASKRDSRWTSYMLLVGSLIVFFGCSIACFVPYLDSSDSTTPDSLRAIFSGVGFVLLFALLIMRMLAARHRDGSCPSDFYKELEYIDCHIEREGI